MNELLELVQNPIEMISNLEKLKLGTTEYITLTLNILLFLFVKRIVLETDSTGKKIGDYSKRIKILRAISLVFFIVFTFSCLFGKKMGAVWSQTYLIMLSSYLVNHWINNIILIKYGDQTEVDGEKRYTDNYISQILRVAIGLTTFVFASLFLIDIWGLNSLLKSGSGLVTIGFLVFATKDFWLEEMMSSLTIHAKGTMKRGSIIELEDGHCYVILETKFIGTRLRNLKTKIETVVPNKTFVRDVVKIHTIETESGKKDWKATKHSIYFNIGYDKSYESVKEFFETVLKESQKKCSSIGSYELNLIDNGDHAVKWEILYVLTNPYHIKPSRDTINLMAFIHQKDFGIDLSTPITYSKV